VIAQSLRRFVVPMRCQIVEDHDGSGRDLRDEYLAHISGEGATVHRALDDPRRDQRVLRQACDKRLCSPTAERCAHCQALAPSGPATQAGQVRFHSRFVNEHNTI